MGSNQTTVDVQLLVCCPLPAHWMEGGSTCGDVPPLPPQLASPSNNCLSLPTIRPLSTHVRPYPPFSSARDVELDWHSSTGGSSSVTSSSRRILTQPEVMDERPSLSTRSLPSHRPQPSAPRPEYQAIFPALSSAYSISATSTSSAFSLASSSLPTPFASTSSQPYSPPSSLHLPPLRSRVPPIRTQSGSPAVPAATISAHRSPSSCGRASSLPHASSTLRTLDRRPISAGSNSSVRPPFDPFFSSDAASFPLLRP